MAKLFSRTNFILTNRTIKFNAKVIQFQLDVIKININFIDCMSTPTNFQTYIELYVIVPSLSQFDLS